jgi:hypothetical protein
MVMLIYKHRRIWGLVILGLLLIAEMGPWGFDLINVPAQYPCSAPFIRLKGDFCGEPVSAVGSTSALLGDLVLGAVTGKLTFIDLIQIIPIILYLLIALMPFMSAILWISSGHHQRQPVFHLTAWGLAAIFVWFSSSLRLLIPPLQYDPGQVWGLWFYTGLVSAVVILEVVAFATRGRFTQAS